MNCQVDSPTRVSPRLKSITITYYKQSSVGDLTCLQYKQENINRKKVSRGRQDIKGARMLKGWRTLLTSENRG